MKIILLTFKSMINPVSNLFTLLMLLMYIFSMIGIGLYGGLVQKSPNVSVATDSGLGFYYIYLNFNDLISGYVTLFCVLVVNNWTNIVEVTAYFK
mmetsp:Transcript_44081/g.59754  ORF Transcript_44081/g.59754 Transcript_44081/m.59754 type:complete len:95 (-) Transcript_44081:69-353(-)